MKYTPKEVAELLKDRPQQAHYIESLVQKAIDALQSENDQLKAKLSEFEGQNHVAVVSKTFCEGGFNTKISASVTYHGLLLELGTKLYARPVTAADWQPIETAPKDGTPIDVWRREWKERACNVRYVALHGGFFESVQSGPSCIRDATHWKPISPEPKP